MCEPNPHRSEQVFKYAVYIRTKEGYIERMNNIISNLACDPKETYGSLAPYVYEEELVGFPESVVHWEKSTGPSVGLALINPSSPSADRNPPPYRGVRAGQLVFPSAVAKP
jgi:hypothetical protein